MLLTLSILCLLLVVSAILGMADAALTTASRTRLQDLERDGDDRAALVNHLLEYQRERVSSTLLVATALVNTTATALAAVALVQWHQGAGLPLSVAVMTLLLVGITTLMPRAIARRHAVPLALALTPWVGLLSWFFRPVVAVLHWAVKGAVRSAGGSAGRFDSTTPDEPAQMLADLRGVIDQHTEDLADRHADVRHERAMLRSVLDLADVDVSEIMVHRRGLVSIDVGLPVEDILQQALDSPYTRLPLWRDEPDNIIGVLHAKALLRAVQAVEGDLEALDVAAIASPPWFVPDSTRLLDQLNAFRSRREHFALVIDEYGTLQGVVTLEDILEEIVGDITDEHDVTVSGVRPQPDGSYIIDGSVTLRDLNREFDWNLPDDDATTLAGLLLHETRSLPMQGQVFLFHGLRFEVLRRQRNQIVSVKVSVLARHERNT
ncbi:HlyC/CorC family transporter [Novispirillum itersonii]|uniref:Mg2+/Co2+ transporter CorB n=1 Tax=Novispirillum itersonii TaxID=189 RepID=A0A7X0DP11_NOVIT|nr:CNNM domain-containing protein [Novispirillum itersonii]MBB6210767.1 Mg2+/Co2+ transporter CorB [Novispirillum itersonii]